MNTLQIYSDLICPWCYIGKRRMEEALWQLPPGTQIVRSWHPFQLNPDMPPSGMDRKVYRSRKFGSWERSQAMDSDVEAAGKTVGIKFRYDLQKHTPNTFDSHRVVWLAARAGVQEAVVESLFRAYFCKGANCEAADVGELKYARLLEPAAAIVIKFLFPGRGPHTVLNLIQPEAKPIS